MNPAAGRMRWAALATHASLIAGLPFRFGTAGVLIALPLLLPLPGLWRGRPYTFAWTSLMVVVYLGGLLMEAFATPGRNLPELLLAVIAATEFCALLLFVRLSRRAP